MTQSIDKAVWDLYEKIRKEDVRKSESKIKNTPRINTGTWTDKVVAVVKISNLASEFGIDKCPECHYNIEFDDGRGWFICVKAKYEGSCDFKGKIAEFMRRCG